MVLGGVGHSPLGWFGEDAHYMPCLCSVDERCTIRQLAIYKDTVNTAKSNAVPLEAWGGTASNSSTGGRKTGAIKTINGNIVLRAQRPKLHDHVG